MFNIIIKVMKRVIIAVFMLYGLDVLLSSLNIVVPINMISIVFITLLGIPGLCTLVALFLLI